MNYTFTNAPAIKNINIIKALLAKGDKTTKQIADATGITESMASRYMRHLVSISEVRISKKLPDVNGRHQVYVWSTAPAEDGDKNIAIRTRRKRTPAPIAPILTGTITESKTTLPTKAIEANPPKRPGWAHRYLDPIAPALVGVACAMLVIWVLEAMPKIEKLIA